MKTICRLLVISLLFFSYHSTAGMIGTEQVASAVSAQAERSHIQSVLSRAEVASALQSMGVDVNTDEEARSLAGKIGAVPAGADSDGWLVVAIVIAVVLLLWWRWR
jgi:hypothetical protein